MAVEAGTPPVREAKRPFPQCCSKGKSNNHASHLRPGRPLLALPRNPVGLEERTEIRMASWNFPGLVGLFVSYGGAVVGFGDLAYAEAGGSEPGEGPEGAEVPQEPTVGSDESLMWD